jgi:hypothetical protein
MAGLIKGKVVRIKRPLMMIKRIDGLEFWTDIHPDIDILDFVWVAWDHTRGKPTRILTKREMEKLISRSTEFSPLPSVEDEGPEQKPEIESEEEYEKHEEMEGELPEYEGDESFSLPKGDEYEVRSFSDPCV